MRKALEVAETALGRLSAATLYCRRYLGTILGLLDRYEEAEALIREALADNEEALGRESLGRLYTRMGRNEEAEPLLEGA